MWPLPDLGRERDTAARETCKLIRKSVSATSVSSPRSWYASSDTDVGRSDKSIPRSGPPSQKTAFWYAQMRSAMNRLLVIAEGEGILDSPRFTIYPDYALAKTPRLRSCMVHRMFGDAVEPPITGLVEEGDMYIGDLRGEEEELC